MKQIYYLKDNSVSDKLTFITWYTYPSGRRTPSPELTALIELYYFQN